jgi:uncharacterized membrane protein YqjE
MTEPDSPSGSDGAASGSGLTTEIPADARLMDLVGRMSSDVSHVVRAELELAKVEIKDEMVRTALAAGLLSGTALAGYFVLLMLSFAAAFGLAEIMATGWAFLIVGLVYGAVAGTLFVLGRKKLATVTLVPKKTLRTLREDLSWLKQQMS